MAKRGTRYSSEFKAKVALEAIREELTLAELSAKYGVTARQISVWKKQALERFTDIFENKKKKEMESKELKVKTDELYRQIGQLKVEKDWLAEKLQFFR